MNLKRMLAIMLALCVVFALCACSGDGSADATDASEGTEAAPDTTPATEEIPQDDTQTVDDSLVTYTITVVDDAGNPIPGAIVQLCLEACTPCDATGADGVTSKAMPEADYKVSFIIVPAGFAAEEAYYFEDGSYEMTITLKAAE